jgi:hypothetical protein
MVIYSISEPQILRNMTHQLSMGTVPLEARPDMIGRGWWGMLHAIAYVHDTSTITNSREMFIDNVVRGIGQHFPCMDCRNHALQHMSEVDPIRNLLRISKTSPDGAILMVCLAWTYRFHEAVNERLKKAKILRPTFSQLEQFLTEMRAGKGCHDCGPIGVAPEEPKPVPQLQRQLLD